MNNVKKVIVSLCVVMMVMGFYVGYSASQEKPSEAEMKGFMLKSINAGKDFKIINLNITNSFYSKVDGSYCIEANFTLTQNGKIYEEVTKSQYSFIKRGNSWYYKVRWP